MEWPRSISISFGRSIPSFSRSSKRWGVQMIPPTPSRMEWRVAEAAALEVLTKLCALVWGISLFPGLVSVQYRTDFISPRMSIVFCPARGLRKLLIYIYFGSVRVCKISFWGWLWVVRRRGPQSLPLPPCSSSSEEESGSEGGSSRRAEPTTQKPKMYAVFALTRLLSIDY